jgi:hypothetical protein
MRGLEGFAAYWPGGFDEKVDLGRGLRYRLCYGIFLFHYSGFSLEV